MLFRQLEYFVRGARGGAQAAEKCTCTTCAVFGNHSSNAELNVTLINRETQFEGPYSRGDGWWYGPSA